MRKLVEVVDVKTDPPQIGIVKDMLGMLMVGILPSCWKAMKVHEGNSLEELVLTCSINTHILAAEHAHSYGSH